MLRHIEKHPNVCVDGVYRKNGLIGYCWLNAHRGYVTAKIMKEHECLQKNCPFLQKFPENSFWIEREKTKQRRLNKKAKFEENQMIVANALTLARELTSDIENFKFVSGEVLENGTVKLNFVSLEYISLGGNILIILENVLGRKVWLHSLKRTKQAKKQILGITDSDADKDEFMEYLNTKSYNNQPDIILSNLCGCFSCNQIFPSDEVVNYKQDTFGTAICPYCGHDTVIPESDEYNISVNLMKRMNQYWFPEKVHNFVSA